MTRSVRCAILVGACLLGSALHGQFYMGSQQQYGKNRVQYKDFLWQQYRFPNMEVYFYKGGRDLARYTARSAKRHLEELERSLDFALDERLQFIVYNSLTDFRQSNIGLEGVGADNNIGGLTRIVGTKIFVYYEGDLTLLDRQIRAGIGHVIIDQMMFGGNWREMVRNSTFMSLPGWFTDGIISYHARPWDAELDDRVRDAVMRGAYDKVNRVQGDDARDLGHAIWAYVADVYGPGVIPNILYMTRVSRNVESGFLFVLGVSLKTLTKECLGYYRSRYAEEEHMRQEMAMDPLPIRTRKRRTYDHFMQSPTGTHMAWVSNELGQYKVWMRDNSTGKVRRIIKGEKKLDRIIDRSYPVLAWHPSGQALTYVIERKGEPFMRTYTLEDRRTTERPLLTLDKVLSMDYAPDGRSMVLSGVYEGRTDLYLYHVLGNSQERLTNDHYTDLDPRFVDDGRIIFSSDRPSDTLVTTTDPRPGLGRKDLFIYDLKQRSPVLTRLTNTPDADERYPARHGPGTYTFLSDRNGTMNRYKVRYDSVVSHIDTAVHYRYFTVEEQLTDLRRSILEQDVRGDRYTQLMRQDGKYRFHAGRLVEPTATTPTAPPQVTDAPPDDPTDARPAHERLVPVVKVPPRSPRPSEPNAIDVRDYVFSDETRVDRTPPGMPATPGAPTTPTTPGTRGAPSALAAPATDTAFTFPEQRNYNVNFTVDEVVTQVDNSFSNQFYQPFSGPEFLNPGLSALTRMGARDLFEDHRVMGGFRLALGLSNNDYMLAYENVKGRLDKRISFQRQAYQGTSAFNVFKVHTHNVQYQLSWPFSELASVRGSVIYRNDRYVMMAIDRNSLRAPNVHDHMVGAKLEYVYDSSLPRGLNLWTGWKLKWFAEYYRHPGEEQSDMQVLGMDLRHSLPVHRELIWVNRLAGATSMGHRKVVHFLGGVDNWLFARVNKDMPIDLAQNYWYQTMSVPMRGFAYNARNGSSFAVFNTELRVPIIRYLVDRPLRSDLFHNLQVTAFADAGTAWTGPDPYSDENSFNRLTIRRNPLTITLDNQREPVVYGYGFGLRTRLLGYFVRADWTWGVDDGVVQPRVFYFSLSLDI